MQRFDLIPANAISGIARVFNQGLDEGHKEEGWKHADVKFLLNKLKEKLNEFERMRDLDDDKLYNIDKVAAYAMMLHDVIATNPQNDNRFDVVSKIPRVALDVDDVVADFLGGYREATGDTTNPYWSSSYKIRENLEVLKEDKDFWVNLKVLHRPNFEPVCYISSRSIPVEWTQEFIQKNGLPCAPVYHVPWNESKVEFLIKNHIDVLVDDKIANFQEAMRAGVFCYLMNAPHNEWFDAKNRRIHNLELFQ